MTINEAIANIIAAAAAYGENKEEGFPCRVEANNSDEDCANIASNSLEWDVEDVIEMRDLWKSIDIIQAHFAKAV
jgi:hypothetical protein